MSRLDPRYISNVEISWEEIKKIIGTIPGNKKFHGIGLLNLNNIETNHWKQFFPNSDHVVLHLDYAEKNVTWDTLYPEWIDEEEDDEIPICQSLPKIEEPKKQLDLIIIKLPCRDHEANWSRDVARLHLQLTAAQLAVSNKGHQPVHLLFVTKCFPIPNLFPCKELVLREGNMWLYKPNLDILREKLQLPVGSCELSLPLKPKGQFKSGVPSHIERKQ